MTKPIFIINTDKMTVVNMVFNDEDMNTEANAADFNTLCVDDPKDLEPLNRAELVKLYNSRPTILKPLKKFDDRATALARTWGELIKIKDPGEFTPLGTGKPAMKVQSLDEVVGNEGKNLLKAVKKDATKILKAKAKATSAKAPAKKKVAVRPQASTATRRSINTIELLPGFEIKKFHDGSRREVVFNILRNLTKEGTNQIGVQAFLDEVVGNRKLCEPDEAMQCIHQLAIPYQKQQTVEVS